MRVSKTPQRVAGVGLIAFIGLAFALTAAFYTHAFANPAEVTLRTARAGLIMEPGSKVKLRGVEIGRVGDVRSVGAGAELVLELDRDQLRHIPADTRAEIKASTVFGSKYVELLPPVEAGGKRLGDGSVLDSTGVTTEVNTVFKSLDTLLRGVDVTDLNQTLTVLATTLSGRGDTIAEMARQANTYLTRLEPLLPQIRADLVQIARFARLGNQISPALLRILENAAVTGNTIATEQQAIDRLLVDLSVLGEKGAKVLGVNEKALVSLLQTLRPTTGTLRAYAGELPCLLMGLDKTQQIMTPVLGGTVAGLQARVSFRGELPPYTPASGLPGLARGRGATCAGLPTLAPQNIPFPERGGPQ